MEYMPACLVSTPIEIFPVSKNSNEIYALKQHGLLGVSPFNSYFTESNLLKLFDWALNMFEKITIFIPDKLSMFNLMALGYTEKEAAYKTLRQDRYLQNKVIRTLKKLGFNEHNARELIITFTQLSSNEDYIKIYRDCLIRFEKYTDFRNGCLTTSSWILEKNTKIANLKEKNIKMAVQYFLREIPLFLDTPTILNVKSSLFIYHQIPKYLEYLYLNRGMVSSRQGFLTIKFNKSSEV